MTDVKQQKSQSSHSQELSKMRMECANQKEEQRQIFEQEKAQLQEELRALIAKSQEERNTFDKERIRKSHFCSCRSHSSSFGGLQMPTAPRHSP